MARRSRTRRGGRARSQQTSGPNGEGRSVREMIRSIALPEIRQTGKSVIHRLAKDQVLKPGHKGIALHLVDLACNIADKVLDPPPPAPTPNPFAGMTDEQIMAELARRTGREILMMPSENGSPTSGTTDQASSSKPNGS